METHSLGRRQAPTAARNHIVYTDHKGRKIPYADKITPEPILNNNTARDTKAESIKNSYNSQFKVGIYGWRKKCLYILVMSLMLMMIINLALTLWVLKVLDFNSIATEFCQFMTQLGGNQQSQLFTPKAIKELFQVEFDTHVARGLQVVPKEMPSVLDRIATVSGNPERSQLAMLEREVTKDIEIERRPDKKMAFGHSLPYKEQWHTPKNNTKAMWRSARHVPRDLVTLKTVWEGITNLRSVREYCRWMIEHPEYRRAPYLRSLGMFDPAVLEARMTLELNNIVAPISQDHTPRPIDHIRRRLSELAETAD